jgi:hypothetical protein
MQTPTWSPCQELRLTTLLPLRRRSRSFYGARLRLSVPADPLKPSAWKRAALAEGASRYTTATQVAV